MLETTTSFLSSLAKNNNREWFADNKGKYLDAKEEFESFVEELIPMVQEMDPGIGHVTLSDCTYRIYRDTRFSADKTPYKNHFGAYINRHGKKSPYAGYYIHISPAEGSLWGGGLYCPEPEILKAVRRDIYENIDEFRSIIDAPEFKDRYTLSQENKLKKRRRASRRISRTSNCSNTGTTTPYVPSRTRRSKAAYWQREQWTHSARLCP